VVGVQCACVCGVRVVYVQSGLEGRRRAEAARGSQLRLKAVEDAAPPGVVGWVSGGNGERSKGSVGRCGRRYE